MPSLETELPANTADGRERPVGMLSHTEIPAELRRSSCWLIGLLVAMKQRIGLKAIDEVGYLDTSISVSGPGEEAAALGDEWQVAVMLVEDKGDHVERMGIGIIPVDSLNCFDILDTERK
jgi:hypothetical protein